MYAAVLFFLQKYSFIYLVYLFLPFYSYVISSRKHAYKILTPLNPTFI